VIKMDTKLGIFLIGIALLVFCAFVGTVSATDVYVPDNYEKIQWAVDNASTGDTIIVRDGTYNENVDVSKSLTIRSENGAAHCIIDADGGSAFSANGFTTPINYVSISGFTVTGGDKGIIFSYSDHNNIANNLVTDCSDGILLYGECANNTITNNLISDSGGGILVDYAEAGGYNSITNNTGGIIYLLSGANHNTVANNIVDGISAIECFSNIITNNTIAKGGFILLGHLTFNNLIYNNYFDNDVNASDSTYYDDLVNNNAWNIEKTEGTNIIGGPYLGGNYWGDYAGTDEDGDGLGDTLLPYNSDGQISIGGDYHPLVEHTVKSCNDAGTPQDSFHEADPVYAIGSGYAATTTYDLYVVADITTWTAGMAIPPRVNGTESSVTTDASGNIPNRLIWGSAVKGEYDLVVDVNGNGNYDAGIDALDSNVDVGFLILDFPTLVLPVASILGLLFSLHHRKRRKEG
jgi:parallel beta-helix repeat protein